MVFAALVGMTVVAARPMTIATVDSRHRLVEGVASDGRTIWVTSVIDREIVECRRACRTLTALPPGLHPLAIAWDGRRRQLWVAADCPAGIPGVAACERGALLAVGINGRIRARLAPLTSGSFHPGDVSVAGGEVFASDSRSGAVYQLGSGAQQLVPLIGLGVGKSAQGTAVSDDGSQLIVADYSQGIGRVDLASHARTLLERPDGKPLRGVDGIARCGQVYYGIYNAIIPGALLAIRPIGRQVTFSQPLGDYELPDPTQVAFDGKRLLIVADSGWSRIDKPGLAGSAGTRILAIPLDQHCEVSAR